MRLLNGLIPVLMLSVLIAACGSRHQEEQAPISPHQEQIPGRSLKQSPRQLLSGEYRAICYSGFRPGQHPGRDSSAVNPSEEEILEDLQILANRMGYKLIRLYDSDESSETVLRMIRDHNLSIKVMLGIWLRAEISNHEGCPWLDEPVPEEELLANRTLNHEEIQRGIRLANEYDTVVVAVNVGNEALVDWNDHMVPEDTVIRYVRQVRRQIMQPVTVADNYKWWALHGRKLAGEVDFVSVHTYPVWEGKNATEALAWSIENLLEVRQALPGATLVITEAGWPTVASEFANLAGEKEQWQYFSEIVEWSKKMNITTFWFEAFDEDWKGDPANPDGAEKHWGLFTTDRQPKLTAKKVMNETHRL